MKQILAFGDSLTWGADPVTGLRHPHPAQWPVVLEAGLTGARVIGDGLGGRTTCRDDHSGPASRNGAWALQLALAVHMPLDLVILMLGTNDLKPVHGGQAISAQGGMRRLAEIVQTFPYKPRSAVPKLLIVAPPPCGPTANGGPAGGRIIAESELFAPLYASLAAELGCAFFDAGTVARPSVEDGVHLDADNTIAIGKALVRPVAELLA
ncbi:SGNH/GDSL hydrolase family protein [Paracoccus litorisediminis]|jgi:lysophospholipase L1-like esterase|uniref:Arylesterase n=1 Tax=Paracoccus litorisediminis TaxID=2006130 RepID=A0A844HJJ6_9RHOB|nr:SGNH/GDSL hydrolase family protein [Paracoccus litorisediminis]MTH57902.1 arylesterase [Paracoccus litorisediminis]